MTQPIINFVSNILKLTFKIRTRASCSSKVIMLSQIATRISCKIKSSNPIAPANVRAKINQRSKSFIRYMPVRSSAIICDFNCNRLIVICSTRTTPRAVLFFNIHTDPTVRTDSVIATGLARRFCEDIAARLDRQITSHMVNSNFSDWFVPWVVAVRRNLSIRYQRTVTHRYHPLYSC